MIVEQLNDFALDHNQPPLRIRPSEAAEWFALLLEGHCPGCSAPFGPPEYVSDYREDYGDQPWLRCDACAMWMRIVR